MTVAAKKFEGLSFSPKSKTKTLKIYREFYCFKVSQLLISCKGKYFIEKPSIKMSIMIESCSLLRM